MNIELYMWHLLPNDLEQPRGFTLWQASFGIADFNQTHCVDFDNLKSLPNPTGNGIEFPLGIFPARLRSVQACVQRSKITVISEALAGSKHRTFSQAGRL